LDSQNPRRPVYKNAAKRAPAPISALEAPKTWAAAPEDEAAAAEPVAVLELPEVRLPVELAEPDEAADEPEERDEPEAAAEPLAAEPVAAEPEAALAPPPVARTTKVVWLFAVTTIVLVATVPLPPKRYVVTPVKPAGTSAAAA